MLLKELKGHKVGICVSGGLDSKTVTSRLLEAGVDCMCFTADLAQPDEKDIQDVIVKMRPTGAETIIVDLKKEMAAACLMMVRAQAMYDGGYWNTTGIARAITVKGLIRAMRAQGCTVLAHGATGRGNDQLRFERYTNVLAPDMKVYAPWRDPELARAVSRAQRDGRLPGSQGHRGLGGAQEALLDRRQSGRPLPRGRGSRISRDARDHRRAHHVRVAAPGSRRDRRPSRCDLKRACASRSTARPLDPLRAA